MARDFMGFFVKPEMYKSLIVQLKKEDYDSISEMIRDVLGQWLVFKGHNLMPDDIAFTKRHLKKW